MILCECVCTCEEVCVCMCEEVCVCMCEEVCVCACVKRCGECNNTSTCLHITGAH